MSLLRTALAWVLAVICLVLLVLSFTRVGTGFFGTGNGLIWSYVLVLVLALVVLVPVMRRTAPSMPPPPLEPAAR